MVDCPFYYFYNCCLLVLGYNVFVQLFILFCKNNEFFQVIKYVLLTAKRFYFCFQIANFFFFPVKNISFIDIPCYAIRKTNAFSGCENLLRTEELRRFTVVASDLVYAKGNSFVFCGVFTFDYQNWNTIDEKYHIFPVGILSVE